MTRYESSISRFKDEVSTQFPTLEADFLQLVIVAYSRGYSDGALEVVDYTRRESAPIVDHKLGDPLFVKI